MTARYVLYRNSFLENGNQLALEDLLTNVPKNDVAEMNISKNVSDEVMTDLPRAQDGGPPFPPLLFPPQSVFSSSVSLSLSYAVHKILNLSFLSMGYWLVLMLLLDQFKLQPSRLQLILE